MKNILITGANGFLGQALVKSLSINENYNLTKVVRKIDNRSDDSYLAVGDINANTKFVNALKNIDVVIHLAARAHVMHDNSSNPYDEYKSINVDGTLNLAKQALINNVKRFIYLSSIKVNGESTNNDPFTEISTPKPEDDYGKTKLEAEVGLINLFKNTNTELVIIRPPLIYGPGVKGNFANLIKLAQTKMPLPFGSINNRRSFIYIDNLIDFISYCIESENAANQIFLISDDSDLSLKELIKLLRLELNKPPLLIPVPIFIFKIMGKVTGKTAVVNRLTGNLQINMNKAKSVLSWKPPFSTKQGLAKTIQSYNHKNN